MKEAPEIKISLLQFYRMAKEDPIGLRTKIFKDYGDIARRKVKGIMNYYFANPNHVKYILGDHADNYFARSKLLCDTLRPVIGHNSLFFDNDPVQWHQDRMSAEIGFDHAIYFTDYAKTIVELCDAILKKWEVSYQDNQIVYLPDEFDTLVVNIVANTMFAQLDINQQVIIDALKNIPTLVRKKHSIPPLLWLLSSDRAKLNSSINAIKELARNTLLKRLNSTEKWDDLIDKLSHNHQQHLPPSKDDLLIYLVDHFITFFVAGFFTTTSLLSWTLIELSRHPPIERKISEEINQVMGHRLPTYQDISALKYLSTVIKEVLRVHPVVFTIMREAIHEDSINDFRIPAHAGIMISPHHIHRHPDFWMNPEGFDPDRFCNNGLGQESPFAFIPFGADKRKCPATFFATLEVMLIVSMVVQRFYLSIPPYVEIKSVPSTIITIKPSVEKFYLKHKRHR